MTTPLAELMTRDPLGLSREDRTAIIAELRAARGKFLQGNTTIGKPESRKSEAQKKREATIASVGQLSLDDLGL